MKSRALNLERFRRYLSLQLSTLHRHLSELEQNGFLERNNLTRAYKLGSALTRLSKIREGSYPIKAVVRPLLIDLANKLGELVHFSVLDGERLKTLVFFDPGVKATRINFDDKEKDSLPIHATASGIALLAFSKPELRQSIFENGLEKFTEHTLIDRQVLETVIETARSNGFSCSAQAFDNEVTSHGCVVFDRGGEPVGAMSVAVPASRLTDDLIKQIKIGLFQITTDITHKLGGEIPELYREIWINGCKN